MRNILVIAAHPDDEILGCGGTLLKHAQIGDKIFVCIVTSAYEPQWSREYIDRKITEAKKVDRILGTTKRFYCDFPTVKLNTVPTGEFNSKISEVINEVNPDVVYTHYENDVNKDHNLIYHSVMVNTRPIEKKIKVCCFETLSSTEWSNKSFSPNMYVNINDHLSDKIKMFLKYESEVKKYPHPRSPEGIKIQAQKRGMDVCISFAEAHQIVRDFWE